jgi:hypothetical protein
MDSSILIDVHDFMGLGISNSCHCSGEYLHVALLNVFSRFRTNVIQAIIGLFTENALFISGAPSASVLVFTRDHERNHPPSNAFQSLKPNRPSEL